MAKAQEYTKAMSDFMGAFPIDTASFNEAFKNSAALGEKFSKVALDAAENPARSPRAGPRTRSLRSAMSPR